MSNLDKAIEKISKSSKTQAKIKNLIFEWAFIIGTDSIGIDEENWPDKGVRYSNEVVMTAVNNTKQWQRVHLAHLTRKT